MKASTILCLYILLLTIHPVQAHATIPYDSTHIELRHPPEGEIRAYRQMNAFQYERNVDFKVQSKFLNRILRILINLLRFILSNEGIAPILRYLILIGLFLFIVIKLSRVRFSSIFYKTGGKVNIPVDEFDIDIENKKLDEVIQREIDRKHYRMAMRLLYLKLLKILTQHHIIQWRKGKTDFNYYLELAGTDLQDDFKKLSMVYKYTWYGNFKPRVKQFDSVYNDFRILFNHIDVEKK